MSLSDGDGAALLGIARASLRHELGLGPRSELPDSGPLAEPRGAFVTLRRGGELRGCIGSFKPLGTLARTVAAMAVSAAKEDPRFEPVRPEEEPELDYHVSALSPCEPMRHPSSIEIGRHGLLVRSGWHRGALLPTVAVERSWDAATFLKHACLKAGLPPDAWRDPSTIVEIFVAEEFGVQPSHQE
jgi:AmmeMemoRadiSam system protein A